VGGASSTEDEYQRHPGHEWGYVLEGELQIKIGFEEYTLKPGDSISFDSTLPHRLANAGEVPVRAIWFVLGRIPGGISTADADAEAPPRLAAVSRGAGAVGAPTAARRRPSP
jgi:hypothetical protein